MLSPLQREALCAALEDVCPTIEALDRMLKFRANQQRARITPAAPLPDMAARIVDHAEREFWTTNLIAALVAQAATNPSVVTLLENHPGLDPRGAPAAVDHYTAEILVGGRLFLSRPALRRVLREIGEGLHSRVLVVNGDPVTGKSFTRTFVSYVLEFDPPRHSEGFRTVYLDLDQQGWTLETFAKQIAFSLLIDPETIPARPASDPEQDSRWLPRLVQWLCDGITNAAYPGCWLILDGFRVSLPAEAYDLIHMLAEFADVGGNGRLRLLLLNYPRPDALLYKHEEVITSPPLTRPEMEAFLCNVFRRSGRPADPAVVQTALDSVVRQVEEQVTRRNVNGDDAPRLRLQLLNVALGRTAQRLLAGVSA